MKSTQELLREHIDKMERAILALAMSEDNAITLLEDCKRDLGGAASPADENAQLYSAAVYNALAAINTAPLQTRPNRQLTDAVTDAKEELKAILEYILDES